MSTSEPPFRILSLDGGGTWALIQVKALMSVYPDARSGHDVLRHFDLAISNSGGSIVLAALAADQPLAQILDLFMAEGVRRTMFVSLPWGPAAKKCGFGPRYRAASKFDGLRAALEAPGDRRMIDWKLTNDAGKPVRLVICGFDYERLREVFFRTTPEPLGNGQRLPIPSQQAVVEATFAEAVHASSNAPVNYFDAPAKFGAGPACFWDGAMGGYNNPVLAGVVEALRDGTVERSSVRVLSIGTGSVLLPEQGSSAEDGLVLRRRDEDLLVYAETAATCILDDPPDAASYVAHVMLGGRVPTGPANTVTDGPIVRMNPLVQPVEGTTTDWDVPRGMNGREFRDLAATDMDAVAKDEIERIATFTDLWLAGGPGDSTAVRNQPIRASRWLEVEIGHGTFGGARDAWDVRRLRT